MFLRKVFCMFPHHHKMTHQEKEIMEEIRIWKRTQSTPSETHDYEREYAVKEKLQSPTPNHTYKHLKRLYHAWNLST